MEVQYIKVNASTDFLTPHCTVVLQQQCDNATLIRLIYTYIHTYNEISFTGLPEALRQVCGTQENLRNAVHNHIHPEMSDTPRWWSRRYEWQKRTPMTKYKYSFPRSRTLQFVIVHHQAHGYVRCLFSAMSPHCLLQLQQHKASCCNEHEQLYNSTVLPMPHGNTRHQWSPFPQP